MGKRSRSFLVATFFVLSLGKGSIGAEPSLKKLYLPIATNTITLVPAYIAQQRGYFKKEGFDVELVVMGGSLSVQALLGGSVEFTTSAGAAMNAALRKMPVRIVMATTHQPLQYLVTHPSLRSIKELKGKKLAMERMGSIGWAVVPVILKRHGLSEKDVSLLQIGTGKERLTALLANGVEAAYLSPPDNLIAVKKGYRQIAFAGDYTRQMQGGLATTKKHSVDDPDEIQRVAKGLLKGQLFFRLKEGEEVMRYMKTFLRSQDEPLLREMYLSTLSAFTREGILTNEEVRDSVEGYGKGLGIKEPVDPDEIFDFQFVKQALGELKGEGWRP